MTENLKNLKYNLDEARKHPLWTKFTEANHHTDFHSYYDQEWDHTEYPIQALWAMYIQGVIDCETLYQN